MRATEATTGSARTAPGRLTGADLDLWKAIIRVGQLLPRHLESDLAAHGAGLASYEVLAVLAAHPDGLGMGQVGALALVSKPRLSVHVRQLEQDGLVATRPDPTDGRATIVTITAAGRRRLRELAPSHVGLARTFVARVQPAHRAVVLEAMVALLDELGDEWRPGH